ncbi:MAG: DsbA family protein [Terriglobales bacterium]
MIKRNGVLALAVALAAAAAWAQDQSALKPPKGSKVAIVIFEDLQCPDCARAAPLLAEAVRAYKIPLVRYDFPLPQHNWSFDAHVLARWFDGKSKAVGNEFREYLFRSQPQITRENLREHAERFAAEHKLVLPFLVDPRGELAAKVKADYALGQRTGVSHTPTIYVVSETTRGAPFVEVVDRSKLFQLIDEMKRAAK